eukprot:Selendium_serpulae@DN5364_c0_g1_i2.p1
MMVFYRMLLSLATVASVCWFFQSALLFTNSEERVSPRRLHDDASNKHADWEQLMRGSPSDLFAPVWIYPHISQGVSEYQLPAPQDAARCKQDDLAHLLVSKAGGGAAGAAPFFTEQRPNDDQTIDRSASLRSAHRSTCLTFLLASLRRESLLRLAKRGSVMRSTQFVCRSLTSRSIKKFTQCDFDCESARGLRVSEPRWRPSAERSMSLFVGRSRRDIFDSFFVDTQQAATCLETSFF